jgi:copper chaperone CopZ
MESGLLEPISPEAGAPSKSYQSIVADPSPITPLPTATELADVVVDVGYTAVAVSGGGGSGAGGAGGAGGGDGSSSATSCALEVQDLVCDACPARVVKALQAMYGTTSCTIDLLGKGSAPSSSSSSSSHGSSGVSGEWREAGRAVVHLIWDSEVPHCGARSAIAILAVLGYPASLAEAAPDGMCVCVTAG